MDKWVIRGKPKLPKHNEPSARRSGINPRPTEIAATELNAVAGPSGHCKRKKITTNEPIIVSAEEFDAVQLEPLFGEDSAVPYVILG